VASLYPFRLTAATLCRLAWQAWREEGYLVRELNFGGGLASGRLPADVQPTVEEYVRAVTGAFRRAWRRHGEVGAAFGGQGEVAAATVGRSEVAAATVGRSEVAAGRIRAVGRKRLPWPELFVEPGRSVIAEAGITLYTVGAVKPVPGHEAYVLVDGGMADNPRPALYGARYRAVLANRPADAASGSYTLAGKACESGDILVRGLELPEPRPGDLVAVLATGAYTHSMASNYNRLPRPAVVFASGGQARLVVRRETYADLARCDLELTGRAEPAAEGVAEVDAEAVAEAEAVPEAVAAGTKGRAAPRR
jgi:diaminopimelate decarboxylase